MLTEADLWQEGKPLRVRDLMHLTGLSRPTIMAELDRGRLGLKDPTDEQGVEP